MKTVIYKYNVLHSLFEVETMNGRPKKKNLAQKPLFVRFTGKQYTALRKISEEDDVSIASIVRQAVAKYLRGRA